MDILSFFMLITTPAIILHGFPYGETSKIVRLLTPGYGLQSAIAKGALRPRSRFGAGLQLLSQGTAQIYFKASRDLQTLGAFDLAAQRPGLAESVERYAAATTLAELVLRLAPGEAHPEIFDLLATNLDRLTTASPSEVREMALAAVWQMVAALGFSPVLDGCARDGRSLPEGPAAFSVADGGLLCASCARGETAPRLEPEERRVLGRFLHEPGTREPVPLTSRRAAAHRRLLARFIRRHAAEERELKALAFWETLSWTDT